MSVTDTVNIHATPYANIQADDPCMGRYTEETMSNIDWKEKRDWDVEKSFKQFVFPAIAAYFLFTLGSYALLDVGPLEGFYAIVVIGFFAGLATFGLAVRAQRRQMADANVGYNVQDGGKPLFLFGKREYTRYRVDRGGMRAAGGGYTPYRDTLEDIRREQRKERCEVCADEIGRSGGYFVETRYLYRIFGYPVREKIIDFDAYCANHKPKDFQ